MKVLIVDDEAPARARLRRLVEELPGCEVIGEADNGRAALEGCIALAPNVVLLDIRMPDMDGIEAARHIAMLDDSPAIVFTTAYDHYAIDAFDAHAVGYLLKPVRRERLQKALAFASRLGRTELAKIDDDARGPGARDNICVRRGEELRLIPVEDIRCFQADQKYVTVCHGGGEDLIDEPLRDLADEFADRFIRIHRSTLVALRFLDRMERRDDGQYEVRLRDIDLSLPVSRRHVSAVKSSLKRVS